MNEKRLQRVGANLKHEPRKNICRCGVCKPDSGRDVDQMKAMENKKIKIFKYGEILNNDLALLLKGLGYKGIVFSYSGVPQKYIDVCEKQGLLWKKEKRGLSNVSVAEEAFNLVFKWFGHMGLRFELKEKNALVIGARGFIGREVCRIAEGFGMNVLDYDVIDERPDWYKKYLKMSEIVFICTPQLSKPLLGRKEFDLMKNRPLIVNISGRPSLVDQVVLHEFLDKNLLLGYTADHEPFDAASDCASQMKVNKCFFQKHQGAKTLEAIERRLLEKQKNINILKQIIKSE